MPVSCHNNGHGTGHHGRSDCSSAAGSPGDHSRVAGAECAKLEAELEELRRQVKGKTPQNSSLPPSTQHPHAKPQPQKRKSKKQRGGQPGHPKHERPLIPTDECDDVQPLKPTRMPTLRREALGQRSGAVAASGVGIARDQAAGDRVSATSAGLPLLWRDDVCAVARRACRRVSRGRG